MASVWSVCRTAHLPILMQLMACAFCYNLIIGVTVYKSSRPESL